MGIVEGKDGGLHRMSAVSGGSPVGEMDSVARSRRLLGERRAFDVLLEAQRCWSAMSGFRRACERNKRYTYGDQWDDVIKVDGKWMTEEEYIREQGSVPLKNNLIRTLVRRALGVYRGQSKEPTCTARDRDEQRLGETMSTVLQCNMQLNRAQELNARCMEEFLISGFVAQRKSYGWRGGREDCWTDCVPPDRFFIDNNMRDHRGWDATLVGEIHDVGFGELCSRFARSPRDYAFLRDVYRAADMEHLSSRADEFGFSRPEDFDFLLADEPGRCRVIEVWRKEQKPRYRCHDYQTGELFKVDPADFESQVSRVNAERAEMGRAAGMPDEEVPLIRAEWFVDDYWYFYFLTPYGDILQEGETPYRHGSHPYVFKAYPFIDGEIHSFVSDVIDQQRYTNRLITLYDWIMRSSAKGVLLMPEDCLPEGTSMDDVAESWAEFNGVIVYRPSASRQVPQQVSNNSTNIGITELLNMQMRLFEEISGVTGALKGKPGFSGQSAALYSQQVQNSTMSLLDVLEEFGSFVVEGAYKDVKNIQQFYDSKRVFNIAGRGGTLVEYDPSKLSDVEFDLSITESTSTSAYRYLANDFLMQLWQSQAISVEELLEHGDFPFADSLLQSIKARKEEAARVQQAEGVPPGGGGQAAVPQRAG